MDGSYGFGYAPNFGDYGADYAYDTGFSASGDCIVVSATSGYPAVGEELYCGCGEISSYDCAPGNVPLTVDTRHHRPDCLLAHSPSSSKQSAGSIRSSFSQDSLATGENGSRCEAAESFAVDNEAFERESREWVLDFHAPMDERRKTRVIPRK